MLDRLQRRPLYEEFAPIPTVGNFVSCFWNFSIPPQTQGFQHAIIPDGMVSLVLIRKRTPDLRLLTISGPRANAWWLAVNAGDSFWGARLLPGSSGPLLGISPRELRNQVRPLVDLAPDLAHRLFDTLADAESAEQAFAVMELELARLAGGAPDIDRVIRQATIRLLQTNGSAKVASLAADAGVSERQFRRRFGEAVGLTPKQFSRAVRVRCACIRLSLEGSARLASIAQDVGYSDQAHLSREFTEVFGLPAGDLSALIRGFEHGEFLGHPMSDLFKT